MLLKIFCVLLSLLYLLFVGMYSLYIIFSEKSLPKRTTRFAEKNNSITSINYRALQNIAFTLLLILKVAEGRSSPFLT